MVNVIITSFLLGVGLAMDAFSVSLANGLNDTSMNKRKMTLIPAVFAVFQALMPMAGWICVHTAMTKFSAFEKIIPYIALILLSYIGIKMLAEGIRHKSENAEKTSLGFSALLVQGVATSIDALSVGFVISDYSFAQTLLSVLIIAVETFIICLAGVIIGKKFGTFISGKTSILGGIILIFIGLEIFISSFLK